MLARLLRYGDDAEVHAPTCEDGEPQRTAGQNPTCCALHQPVSKHVYITIYGSNRHFTQRHGALLQP